jgi:hypothetical protein
MFMVKCVWSVKRTLELAFCLSQVPLLSMLKPAGLSPGEQLSSQLRKQSCFASHHEYPAAIKQPWLSSSPPIVVGVALGVGVA